MDTASNRECPHKADKYLTQYGHLCRLCVLALPEDDQFFREEPALRDKIERWIQTHPPIRLRKRGER
jgi:hypothetical protein